VSSGRRNRQLAVAVGVAVIVVVAVLDVALSTAVLRPLLVAAPLVAALGADPRATALVGAGAVAACVLLGFSDDDLGGFDHVVEIVAVALGGALAVLAAAARHRFERAVGATASVLAVERRARVRADFLDRASRLIEAPPEPRAMLDQIVRIAVPDMAELCIVDLLADDGQLRGAAVFASDPRTAEALHATRQQSPLSLDSAHPVAEAARTGGSLLLPELPERELRRYASSEEHLRLMLRLRYTSAVVVPLVARGRPLGVLSFLRFAGQPSYDDEDLELAAEIARRAALALDNARLFAHLSRTEQRLETVLENLGEAVTVQRPDGSLVFANQAAADLFEAASPEELVAMPLAEVIDRFVILDEDGRSLTPEQYPRREALQGRTPEPAVTRFISRATGEERWVVTKTSPVIDEDDRQLVVNVIEDITEERRSARQQRFLSDASKLVSSSLDTEATLDKVAWAVVPEIADWCCVDVPDERGVLRRRALAADDDRRAVLDRVRAAVAPDGDDAAALGSVLVTGEALHVPQVGPADLEAWSGGRTEALEALRASETCSLVVVPMVAGDRVLGLVTLATAQSGRMLGARELALAEELGRRAGIAVANAQVHEARSHIASTLQRSLLPPRLPVVPGLTIAARFRAAGEATDVGGDFYDLFGVGDAWMVVIGDVTGKGPTAAATTSLARYTMRTAAMYERSPAAVLRRLNATLAVEPDRRQLCTAVCARVEHGPDGAIGVVVACGGHPAPYLLSDGHADPVGGPGPLLGAFDDGAWLEERVSLGSGDSLVFYTDGVTDTRGESGRFGTERLAGVLSAAAGLEADEVATRVDEALVAFEASDQRDDVALLVLQAAGGPASVASLLAAARGAPAPR
jgi:PAS domain S-box-containing protein